MGCSRPLATRHTEGATSFALVCCGGRVGTNSDPTLGRPLGLAPAWVAGLTLKLNICCRGVAAGGL